MCPECKSRTGLIEVVVKLPVKTMYDLSNNTLFGINGADLKEFAGKLVEVDLDSFIKCVMCDYEGKVIDFSQKLKQ